MKRKLSLLIAIVMVLSLLPAMSVSAASTNSIVVGGGQVASDFTWYDDDPLVGPNAGAGKLKSGFPVLRIVQENTGDDWDGYADTSGLGAGDPANYKWFTLSLNNAEWAIGDFIHGSTVPGGFAGGGAVLWSRTAGTLTFTDGTNDIAGTGYAPFTEYNHQTNMNYIMHYRSRTIVDVAVTSVESSATPEILIPLIVKMKGEGAASVTIENADPEMGLTLNTRNFATGVSGATRTTVRTNDTSFSRTLNLDAIVIQETSPSTIELDNITLTAPSGFEWVKKNASTPVYSTVTFYQGFSSKGFTNLTTATPGHDAPWSYPNTNDSGVIRLALSGITAGAQTDITTGAISIAGLQLTRSDSVSQTPTGDVMVRVAISGGTTESVRVGIFANRSVTLTAEDKALPEVMSGVYKTDPFTESTRVLDVTIKENSVHAWNERAEAVFKLPDGVKFRAVKIQDWSNIQSGGGANKGDEFGLTTDPDAGTGEIVGDGADNTTSTDLGDPADPTETYLKLTQSSLTFRPYPSAGRANMSVTFRVWVTVRPGFTGDITFNTDEDNEAFAGNLSAVVGKAIDPVTVTAKSTDVHIGYMRVAVGDIVIKENQPGALKRSMDVSGTSGDIYFKGSGDDEHQNITFEIGRNTDVVFKDGGKAEVVSGDILLGDYKNALDDNARTLSLPIKRASTVASEVKLSGMTVDVNRSVPEGKLELRIGGSLVANYHNNPTDKDNGSFDTRFYVGTTDYVNVITAAPDKDVKYTTEVAVTIGSSTILANGVEVPTDAAAFIKDGYTMIPVRAAAVALGIHDSQIHWDANNKIVTIQDTGRGGAAQFQVGSNYINKNGMMMGFDGPSALVENGRTFLPFRALGEIVLNCPVDWDEASKTAYFNKGGGTTVAATPAPAATEEAAEEEAAE